MVHYLRNGGLLILSGLAVVILFCFDHKLGGFLVMTVAAISVPFYVYYVWRYLNLKDYFWSHLVLNREKEYLNYCFHRPLLIMSFAKERRFQFRRNRAILRYDRKLAGELVRIEKKLGVLELVLLWGVFWAFPHLAMLIKK